MTTQNPIPAKEVAVYLEGTGTFGYFVLFLSPLTFTGNIIVTISAFLVSRKACKDTTSVYISQCLVASANIVSSIGICFELIVLHHISNEHFCDIKSDPDGRTTIPMQEEADGTPPGYTTAVQEYYYFIVLLSPLIMTGSVLVVFSSVKAIRLGVEPIASYMCLGNIAIADLSSCLATLFGLVGYPAQNDLFPKYFCPVQIGLIVSGSLTSMLSICLIALERYLYVVHGLKYDFYLTPVKTFLLIVLVWITGMGFGLVPILLEASSFQGPEPEVCEFIHSPLPVQVAAATVAIPAIVITPLLYSGIYCNLRRLEAKTSSQKPGMKIRSVLMVFFSSVSFLICWGPFIVAVLVYKFYCETNGLPCFQLLLAIDSPLACLAFANSLLNPLIYAWWHPPYRSALGKVLCPNRPRARARDSLRVKTPETVTSLH